jgi:hypothetical protein
VSLEEPALVNASGALMLDEPYFIKPSVAHVLGRTTLVKTSAGALLDRIDHAKTRGALIFDRPSPVSYEPEPSVADAGSAGLGGGALLAAGAAIADVGRGVGAAGADAAEPARARVEVTEALQPACPARSGSPAADPLGTALPSGASKPAAPAVLGVPRQIRARLPWATEANVTTLGRTEDRTLSQTEGVHAAALDADAPRAAAPQAICGGCRRDALTGFVERAPRGTETG